MALNHMPLQQSALLLPITIFNIYIFALGVSLFLSAAFVKYRDVTYIWDVGLQAGFYATPIIYSLTLIPSLVIQKLLFISPLTQTIQDARYELVTHQTITIFHIFDGGWYVLIPYDHYACYVDNWHTVFQA